jgi:hypothetical protein
MKNNKKLSSLLEGIPFSKDGWNELKILKEEVRKSLTTPQYFLSQISAYQQYQKIFGVPERVLYPACGIDASPLKGFPKSRVTLLDPDREVAEVMRNAGIPIVQKKIQDYSGPKQDLILLMNPQNFPRSLVIPHLEENGRIIANNWTGAANELEALGLPILGRYELSGEDLVPTDKNLGGDPYVIFGKNE